MAFTWQGVTYTPTTPTLKPQYLVGQLDPGQTMRRLLLWVEGILEYTSPDSLAGTPMMYGLVYGPSDVTPPLTGPYTDYSDPTSGVWIWTWPARFKYAYAVPGSSPVQYVDYADLNTLSFDIQVQRKNVTASPQHLWFLGEVYPGVTGPSLTTSVYTRILTD
jgi:hypothetical protein